MNLNTSDQRLKKHTVSISNDVLKKIQRSVNKKINNLRAQGKIGNPNHGLKTLNPMNMDLQTYGGMAKQLPQCWMVAQDYSMRKSSEICDTGHLWQSKLT